MPAPTTKPENATDGLETRISNAVAGAIHKAVAELLSGYSSPIKPLVDSAIASRSVFLTGLLTTSIDGLVGDEAFRDEIRAAMRQKLAKTLVDRMGGELEKQVNALKADPTTRARITLAIEAIVAKAVPA